MIDWLMLYINICTFVLLLSVLSFFTFTDLIRVAAILFTLGNALLFFNLLCFVPMTILPRNKYVCPEVTLSLPPLFSGYSSVYMALPGVYIHQLVWTLVSETLNFIRDGFNFCFCFPGPKFLNRFDQVTQFKFKWLPTILGGNKFHICIQYGN